MFRRNIFNIVSYLLVYLWRATLSQKPLEFRIPEEIPVGTVIGNIVSDNAIALDKKYSQDVLNKLQFSFISSQQYLTIGQTSGILRSSKRIDRDEICYKEPACTLSADIAVRPLVYFQMIKVNVEILDINDNAPTFSKERILLNISESKEPGVVSTIPAAYDLDSGIYNVQRYEVISPYDRFRIMGTDPEGADMVKLVLKEKLDREEREVYEAKVIAYDGGTPTKSGTSLIHITVTDVNDNMPKFEKDSYEARILENTSLDTTIVRVRARDQDAGLNGEVVYAFSKLHQTKYGGLFGIVSATGEIYLKSRLDYKAGSQYRLSVLAKDKGPESMPVNVKVTIVVVDINDHAPEITINALIPGGKIQLSESSKRGSFVAFVSVTDQDGGKNGQFNCKLSDSNFGLKKLYASQYQVITKNILDRETRSRYDIAFQCTDHGNPPMSSRTFISITVLDENDNDPVFSQPIYFVAIDENNEIGASIVHVNATDHDAGKNGEIHYAIGEDTARYLSINSHTGMVTAGSQFDREQLQDLEGHILAVDHGEPRRTATATILLTINDVNDEKPMFSRSKYTFSVLDQQQAGSEVGRVFATDADSDANKDNKFLFSIETQSSPNTFEIDPYTGVITTKKLLSRHNHSTFEIVILATDALEARLYSKANVSIRVADGPVTPAPPTPRPGAFWSGNNLIIVLALAGALGLVLIILIVVLVVYTRRRRRLRQRHGYISGNLVRVIHSEVDLHKKEYDSMRKGPRYWDVDVRDLDRRYHVDMGPDTSRSDQTMPIRDTPMTPGDYEDIEVSDGRGGKVAHKKSHRQGGGHQTVSHKDDVLSNEDCPSDHYHRKRHSRHSIQPSSQSESGFQHSRDTGFVDSDSSCTADISNTDSSTGDRRRRRWPSSYDTTSRHSRDQRPPRKGKASRSPGRLKSSRYTDSKRRQTKSHAKHRYPERPLPILIPSSPTAGRRYNLVEMPGSMGDDSSNLNKVALVHPRRNGDDRFGSLGPREEQLPSGGSDESISGGGGGDPEDGDSLGITEEVIMGGTTRLKHVQPQHVQPEEDQSDDDKRQWYIESTARPVPHGSSRPDDNDSSSGSGCVNDSDFYAQNDSGDKDTIIV